MSEPRRFIIKLYTAVLTEAGIEHHYVTDDDRHYAFMGDPNVTRLMKHELMELDKIMSKTAVPIS
jgi:hypothetical protein